MLLAYPDPPTAIAGSSLHLRLLSDEQGGFRVRIYRQGKDEMLVEVPALQYPANGDWDKAPRFFTQGSLLMDPAVDWTYPAIEIPLPENTPPGVYLAMCETPGTPPHKGFDVPDGRFGKALFVVRGAVPKGRPIICKLPLFTYHAYNNTGTPEKSFYTGTWSPIGDFADVQDAGGNNDAPIVSLNRPGGGTGGTVSFQNQADELDETSSPRQTFAHWDAYFVRYLESEFPDLVDYCTDLDLHVDPHLLSPYCLFLSIGHDEYWTDEMRKHVETFRDLGRNLAFFSGNTCWWHVNAKIKPLFDLNGTPQGTSRRISRDRGWWNLSTNTKHQPGLDWPENSLTGVSYRNGGGNWDPPRDLLGFTLQNVQHWVFSGTVKPPLQEQEVLGRQDALVGYECDGAFMQFDGAGKAIPADGGGQNVSPRHFLILGFARLDPKIWQFEPREGEAQIDLTRPRFGTMGVYTAPSGGTVFTAATVDWARVLMAGKNARDSAIVWKITSNVVRRLQVCPMVLIRTTATHQCGLYARPWETVDFTADLAPLKAILKDDQGKDLFQAITFHWNVVGGAPLQVVEEENPLRVTFTAAGDVYVTVSVFGDGKLISTGNLFLRVLTDQQLVELLVRCQLRDLMNEAGVWRRPLVGVGDSQKGQILNLVDPLWDDVPFGVGHLRMEKLSRISHAARLVAKLAEFAMNARLPADTQAMSRVSEIGGAPHTLEEAIRCLAPAVLSASFHEPIPLRPILPFELMPQPLLVPLGGQSMVPIVYASASAPSRESVSESSGSGQRSSSRVGDGHEAPDLASVVAIGPGPAGASLPTSECCDGRALDPRIGCSAGPCSDKALIAFAEATEASGPKTSSIPSRPHANRSESGPIDATLVSFLPTSKK